MLEIGAGRGQEHNRIRLIEAIQANDVLAECLSRISPLDLPDWYFGAGCVTQTVWNIAHEQPPTAHILDYDLVYYDHDLSVDKESAIADEARRLLIDLPVTLDVKNQARVHLWYPEKFGQEIQPYLSVEEAIATWPTTASAVGVRRHGQTLHMYAPFGEGDLIGLVVRANRVQVPRGIFEAKARRWETVWPKLKVLPWDQGVGAEGRRHVIRSSRSQQDARS